MQAEMQSVFSELFAECCQEMFRGLDCEITAKGNISADTEMIIAGSPTSIIDAGSEDIELNLIMRMPYTVLAMTYPVSELGIAGVPDEMLEDWLSELGNLLMGKIKSRLARHQCEISMGLPTNYFGGEIEELPLEEGAERFDFAFDLDHELCGCVLDVSIYNPDLQFNLEEGEDEEEVVEGELELF